MRALFERYPLDEFICIGDRQSFEAWSPTAPNARLVAVEQSVSPTRAAAADGSRSLADMLALTRAVHGVAPDVFYSPSVYSYYPLPPRLPAVVTIMDTIAERFPHLTLPSRKAQIFWNLKVRLALLQSRLVMTISNYSARSIAEVLRVSPKNIRVCTLAPSPTYAPAPESSIRGAVIAAGVPPGAPYFIYVGGFNPHKRVDLIVRAHAAIAATSDPAPHLLLVGTRTADVFHGEGDRLDNIVRESGTGSLVHWTGYLPDEAIAPLHSGAVALLLPSECEGFGLTAVEAAACGTAVIATTESPLPELLDGGGLFVPPGNLDALTSAMQRLLHETETRRVMAARALANARALTWEGAADSVHAALVEAAR